MCAYARALCGLCLLSAGGFLTLASSLCVLARWRFASALNPLLLAKMASARKWLIRIISGGGVRPRQRAGIAGSVCRVRTPTIPRKMAR